MSILKSPKLDKDLAYHSISDSKDPLRFRWLSCLTVAFFFFYEFIQINMLASLSEGITKAFHPTSEQLGFLSASYFLGNIFFLFPAGMILDKYRTKTIILIAMALSVSGTFLFALSHSLPLMILGRFISGCAGGSFCFLSAIKLASKYFPSEKMAFVTGIIVTIAMLGGIVAQTPFVLLIHQISWNNAVLCLSGLGVGIIFFIAILVRDDFQKEGFSQSNDSLNLGIWKNIQTIILYPQNWLCGVYTSLLNLPILLLGALWGSIYLVQAHQLTTTQASLVLAMLYLGTILGSPIFGEISDRMKLRRPSMLVGVLLSLSLVLIIMLIKPLPYPLLILLFLLLGFFSSTQSISYPVITESNPKHLIASATGFSSAIIMAGGAVFQPLFGWFISFGWNGAIVQGVPVYSTSNLMNGMLILPIGMLVSLFCVMKMKETYCRNVFVEKNLISEKGAVHGYVKE
jgi:MFS family permease